MLDYIFDAPDLNTTRSKIVRDDLVGINDLYDLDQREIDSIKSEYPILDNDKILADAIYEAQLEGVMLFYLEKLNMTQTVPILIQYFRQAILYLMTI